MGPLQLIIQEKLVGHFQPEFIELVNESRRHHGPADAETHFKLQIVSHKFEGLKLIERQRMVHELLKEELKGPVHALTQKLYTPEEWNQLNPNKKIFKAIGHTRAGSSKKPH